MRLFGFIAIIGLLQLSGIGFAQEQESPIYTVEAVVFNDQDKDYVINEATDLQLGQWPIELYDSTFNALDFATSSETDATSLSSNVEPSYICIVPQLNWIQSVPANGTPHPTDPAWFCHEVDSLEGEPASFAVFADNQEPEAQPGVLGESNSVPDTKDEPVNQPSVLGATDEVDILAETGAPSLLTPIVGLLLLTLVLKLAHFSKLQ